MYLRAAGRRFTQMNAYFLLMNSKRCKQGLPLVDSWSRGLAFIHLYPERGNILNPSEGNRTTYYTYTKYQKLAVKFTDQG